MESGLLNPSYSDVLPSGRIIGSRTVKVKKQETTGRAVPAVPDEEEMP